MFHKEALLLLGLRQMLLQTDRCCRGSLNLFQGPFLPLSFQPNSYNHILNDYREIFYNNDYNMATILYLCTVTVIRIQNKYSSQAKV